MVALRQTFKRFNNLVSILDARLILASILTLIMMGLASQHADAREVLCSVGICFYSKNADWWNKLIYDLSAGSLISIVFYWLLVRWPDHQKKLRIKRSFSKQYKAFKLSCIGNFLAVADGGFDSKLPEKLMSLDAFREYFKQKVADDRIRWHEVANNMTDYYLDMTILQMEALRDEISFLLHNTSIEDEKVLAFLKALSDAMILQKKASRDYDSIKLFLGFFWKLFAGWDFIEGYRARDLVEEMIESI